MNERAIEVPIVWKIVSEYSEGRILEVGNVLSHYFSVCHDILDKYEKADGVINQDVVNFWAPNKYELIVSISTLEHVGWDESPRDPNKILRAIENLKRHDSKDIAKKAYNWNNDEKQKLLKKVMLKITLEKAKEIKSIWAEMDAVAI